MAEEIDLGLVDFITVGTIGPPGQRVFHLQAGRGTELFTLTFEKEQAIALADSIMTVLEEIKEHYDESTPETDVSGLDMDLHEPILPVFRIAQMGLGYDVDADKMILVVNELLPEDAPAESRVVRMQSTREQMRALAEHARKVVASGRPICGNCGQPIDPDGHFCPKSNGHGKKAAWA